MRAEMERLSLIGEDDVCDEVCTISTAHPEAALALELCADLPAVRWEKVAEMRARLAEGELATAEELADAILARAGGNRCSR